MEFLDVVELLVKAGHIPHVTQIPTLHPQAANSLEPWVVAFCADCFAPGSARQIPDHTLGDFYRSPSPSNRMGATQHPGPKACRSMVASAGRRLGEKLPPEARGREDAPRGPELPAPVGGGRSFVWCLIKF